MIYFGNLYNIFHTVHGVLKEKVMTEDETVGWHHWLDGHEFEQAPGFGDGQGSLVWCGAWGGKESDTTEWLNWTDHIFTRQFEERQILRPHTEKIRQVWKQFLEIYIWMHHIKPQNNITKGRIWNITWENRLINCLQRNKFRLAIAFPRARTDLWRRG